MKIKMTRRVLDKKIVKISFNESSDEQEDFNCSWDLNFSSDEEIFLKGKSEILWSRTRDLFESPDSFQSFSDFTGRTLSSCSWHNDEFDMKSTSKVNASLEAIENALYEKVKSPIINDNVFQECCDWAEKFPFFRIKGEQIIKPIDVNFTPYSANAITLTQFDLGRSTPSLHLEGKKVPIHATSKSKGTYCDNDNKVPPCFEETVSDEEVYEEYFAVHKSDQPGGDLQIVMNDNNKPHPSVKILQNKILDKLVSEMWPSVISFLEKLDVKSLNNISEDLQLPPITVATEQKRALCLKRPKTEGCGIIGIEFPKLESILSVSPKVLQKRELGSGSISRATRPNSEMSVNPRMSSKSIKPACHQTSLNNVKLCSDCPCARAAKGERESENLYQFLPALEEDFQDSTSILRGFHIEPERKETTNKTVLSCRNEDEILNVSRENDYYLPPIEDKNYLPSNAKLTKNLFTYYGSPVMVEKNKCTGSAKYRKANSRPNTSVSKRSVKNHEVSQPVPIKSGLYINAKSMNKTSSSTCIEKSLEVSFGGDEPVEENQEKLVTLFPIVTSLTPHEDKNHAIKKGLLHTFLGGRKR